jgi:hypothetical protein
MSDIKIITAPDILHSTELSFLLIHPSKIIKDQFQELISNFDILMHVYLCEQDSYNEVEWLLAAFHKADIVIMDIDNSLPNIRALAGYFLSKDKTYWLTKSTDSYYNIVSKNQIFGLDYLTEILGGKLEN